MRSTSIDNASYTVEIDRFVLGKNKIAVRIYILMKTVRRWQLTDRAHINIKIYKTQTTTMWKSSLGVPCNRRPKRSEIVRIRDEI